MVTEAGQIIDTGEIAESDPPTRLVIKWRSEWDPELRAEGYSRCAFDIGLESSNATKLAVTHSIEKHPSHLIEGASIGWPKTLSKLKTAPITRVATVSQVHCIPGRASIPAGRGGHCEYGDARER